MRRDAIINNIIERKGYKSYLEIGVDNPNNCFNRIKCNKKVGVDPIKGGTVKATSDKFFVNNKDKFDIIFIDGLHIDEQLERDIVNSLKILKPGGTIVVHDLLPKTELEQKVPREQNVWTGNCWRAWAKFRATRKTLKMVVINTDHGIGIITRGRQTLYTGPIETYKDFDENREKMMNVKSFNEAI